MRESPSSEMSLHGGLVKAADPHLDPHEETSGRKQWKHGGERVFQFQRKRSKTSRKRYFQNFSTLCNQQVGGSNPSTSSILPQHSILNMGEFPSGQRGQTVNLLLLASVVRIHPPPPDYVPDFTVGHIFLSIHAGLRAFFRFKKGLVSHYCHPRFQRYLQN